MKLASSDQHVVQEKLKWKAVKCVYRHMPGCKIDGEDTVINPSNGGMMMMSAWNWFAGAKLKLTQVTLSPTANEAALCCGNATVALRAGVTIVIIKIGLGILSYAL